MLLRNKKNIHTTKELKASYDQLYDGFLKEHSTELEAEFMLNLIKPEPGQRLLDVSSGKGDLVAMACKKGLKAVGIELSSKALELAKKQYPDCEYIQADAENLPFEDNAFDYVMNLGSLEHYLNPEKGCKEMVRVLKDDGTAVILLPNSHDIITIYHVYHFGTGPNDMQDYERFASRKEWHDFLEEHGFEVVETHKFDRKLPGKPFKWFNFLYNVFIYRIPLNLSRVFVFVCKKRISGGLQ